MWSFGKATLAKCGVNEGSVANRELIGSYRWISRVIAIEYHDTDLFLQLRRNGREGSYSTGAHHL